METGEFMPSSRKACSPVRSPEPHIVLPRRQSMVERCKSTSYTSILTKQIRQIPQRNQCWRRQARWRMVSIGAPTAKALPGPRCPRPKAHAPARWYEIHRGRTVRARGAASRTFRARLSLVVGAAGIRSANARRSAGLLVRTISNKLRQFRDSRIDSLLRPGARRCAVRANASFAAIRALFLG